MPPDVKDTGEEFLLLGTDSNAPRGRIVLLGISKALEALEQATMWLSAGMLRTAPRGLAFKAYTVYGVVSGQGLPLFYSFLSDKTTATDARMRRCLASVLTGAVGPVEQVMVRQHAHDLKPAAMNTARRQFPRHQQQGCWFHFKQALFPLFAALAWSRSIQSIPSPGLARGSLLLWRSCGGRDGHFRPSGAEVPVRRTAFH